MDRITGFGPVDRGSTPRRPTLLVQTKKFKKGYHCKIITKWQEK